MSAIRGLDANHFDYVIAVVLGSDFDVAFAYQLPCSLVRRFARCVKHTDSHRLVLTPALVADAECLAVSERLSAALR